MATTDSSPGARKGEVRFVVDAALLFQLGERGNSEKPDWMRTAVTGPTESALAASQHPANGLTAISIGTMELVEQFRR